MGATRRRIRQTHPLPCCWGCGLAGSETSTTNSIPKGYRGVFSRFFAVRVVPEVGDDEKGTSQEVPKNILPSELGSIHESPLPAIRVKSLVSLSELLMVRAPHIELVGRIIMNSHPTGQIAQVGSFRPDALFCFRRGRLVICSRLLSMLCHSHSLLWLKAVSWNRLSLM